MKDKIEKLIKDYKCTGINSIIFGNGEMVLLDINCYSEEFNISPICDSTIESYLKYNSDCLSSFDIFAKNEDENYEVFAGDGSGEGNGIIYVINKKTEELIWFCFFEESESFKKVNIKNNSVYALSESNITWKVPIKNPLEIELVK